MEVLFAYMIAGENIWRRCKIIPTVRFLLYIQAELSNRHWNMSLVFRSKVLHDIDLEVKGLWVVFKVMVLEKRCED